MMVIVPRIAVVGGVSTTPIKTGMQHKKKNTPPQQFWRPPPTNQAFSEHKADIALIPAAAMPSLTDARIVTEYCVGGVPASKEALLASDDALVGAWKPFGKLPCAFAVWAAHADTDPDAVEALQHALTYGLEHGYEAILESAFAADPGRAYAELAHFDYIFDNQKDKALKKFWNSGLKAVPRANPG